jgi:hypothetical protein
MAITIKGTEFKDLSPSEAKCEMDFIQGPVEDKRDEFHLIGVAGSYSSRGGYMAQNIVALLRYRNSDRATVLDAFSADLYAWTNVAPFTITGPDGWTYSRCSYMGHTTRNRGHATGGTFFLIVEVHFRSLGMGDTA